MMTIEQHPCVCRNTREPLQIGDDHNRKLESLRLVNRHQTHGIGSLIDLSLTLAAANRLKLFDVTHKIANQMSSRALETGSERKQPLDVREPLRAVEVCRNNRQEFRLRDCVTQ